MRIKISMKHDDRCNMTIEDEYTVRLDSTETGNGYMPYLGVFGGDYTELEIDNATGKILNWKPISENEIDDYVEEHSHG